MSSSPGVTWLAFTPRDTLAVGDGRSYRPGTGEAAALLPLWPSTIAGAVGAACGSEPADVRGPVLACQAASGMWEPYFPVPADLAQAAASRGTACRMAPVRGAVTDLGSELALLQPPPGMQARPLVGWLPRSMMTAYLSGTLTGGDRTIALGKLGLVASPGAAELRAGVALDPDRTPVPGYRYQEAHLRLGDGWAFLAACRLTAGQLTPTGPARLGGRGRQADISAAPGAGWPDAPGSFAGGRVLVYVATPAIWPGGWQIPLPPDARLAAAAVGEPVAIATAAPGSIRDTRTLRWAVPAGSVYLLEFGDKAAAGRWAARHHGEAYGRPAADRLRTAGFGVILTGAWS